MILLHGWINSWGVWQDVMIDLADYRRLTGDRLVNDAAIYLAPDPDREGEAIAWHLQALLEDAVPADQFCDPVVTQSPLGVRHVLGGLQS